MREFALEMCKFSKHKHLQGEEKQEALMRVKAQSYPTNAATCMKVLANEGVAASHKTLPKN